jgi:hypothetical protein
LAWQKHHLTSLDLAKYNPDSGCKTRFL